MEPPLKRQRLSSPAEHAYEKSSDDDDDIFYAAPTPSQNPRNESADHTLTIRGHEDEDSKDHFQPVNATSYPSFSSDGEIEVLDSGEEVSDLDEEAIYSRRSQALNKVRTRWDEIIAKYGQEFENADVIDINTLEVVEDNGHIKKMKDENDPGVAQKRRDMRAVREEEEHERAPEALGNYARGNRLADKQNYGDRHRSHETKGHLSPQKEYQQDYNQGRKRRLSSQSPQKKIFIYEDSSDDDFLYENPAPTLPTTSISRRPLQTQSSNQVRRDRPRTSFVEKRTIITTKTITTSRIGDDRHSQSLSSLGPSGASRGRQLSHERTSREIKQYCSSQAEIIESSEEELVQREPSQNENMLRSQRQQKLPKPESLALRSPSPPGRQSLWLPEKAPGRPPKAYTRDEAGSERRGKGDWGKTPRRVVYEGPRRPRGRPRKYPLPQQTSTDSPAEDSSATNDANQAPNPFREVGKEVQEKPPMVFARNVVPKGYDFSDEDDEPTQPSVQLASTAQPHTFPAQNDAFVAAEDDASQLSCQEEPALVKASQPAPDNYQTPQPPHNVEDLSAPQHQPAINTCVTTPWFYFPHTETPHEALTKDPNPASLQNANIPLPAAAIVETQLDDLSIPIDPALLAIDADNTEKRAKSLERAQAELEEQAMREFCDAEILVDDAPIFEDDEGIAGDEAEDQGNETLAYMLGQLEQDRRDEGDLELEGEENVAWDDESDDDLESFLVPIPKRHVKYAPVLEVEAELTPTREESQPVLADVPEQEEDMSWLNEGEAVPMSSNEIEDAILPSRMPTPEVDEDVAQAPLDSTEDCIPGQPPSAEFMPVSFFTQPAEESEPVPSQPPIESQDVALVEGQPAHSKLPSSPRGSRFDTNKEIPDSQADFDDDELLTQPAFSSSAPLDVVPIEQTMIEMVDKPVAPPWSPWRGLQDDGELGGDGCQGALGGVVEDDTELCSKLIEQQEEAQQEETFAIEEVCRRNSTDPGYVGQSRGASTDSWCGGLFVPQTPGGSPSGQVEESEDELELVSSIQIPHPKSEPSMAMKQIKVEKVKEDEDEEDELSLQPTRPGTPSLSNLRSQPEPTSNKTPNTSTRTANDAIRTYAKSQRSKSLTPAPLRHFSLSVSPNCKATPGRGAKSTPKLKNRLLSESASRSAPVTAVHTPRSATPSGRTTNASRHPLLSRSMSPVPMPIRSPKSRAKIQARARAESQKTKLENGMFRGGTSSWK